MPLKGKLNKTWSAEYIHAMKWRWFPIFDRFVDVFMSRDIDSIIYQREIKAVNAWLESDKPGHIMRGMLTRLFWSFFKKTHMIGLKKRKKFHILKILFLTVFF